MPTFLPNAASSILAFMAGVYVSWRRLLDAAPTACIALTHIGIHHMERQQCVLHWL